MDHRIPKIGTAISIILAIGAMITFLFLNKKFEGPDPVAFLSDPYELTARFENTKTLPTKQPVLFKGVSVGGVNAVDYDPEAQEGVVTFTINGDFGPVYSDAQIQIGERSLLGDAYLNLVARGTEAAGKLEPGEEVTGVLPHVNFDEALDFLDEEGRARVHNLVATIAEGAAPRGNGERLNSTVGGLTRTVTELRTLTNELRGQESDLSALVSDSATVVDELGSREQAVRTIVASGRATLDALASNTDSLQLALEELPRLLESGRLTLADSRPLLIEARPVVEKLGRIAPRLTPAFDEGAPFAIGPISSDLVDIIEGLPAQRRASERYEPQITRLNRIALPLIQGAGPASLNSVPIAGYLAPRAKSFAAFFANGSSVIAHGDSIGTYARFGLNLDSGLTADAPVDGQCDLATGAPTVAGSGFCYNAYPKPGDSRDNRPFDGSYPRLRPFKPANPNSLRP